MLPKNEIEEVKLPSPLKELANIVTNEEAAQESTMIEGKKIKRSKMLGSFMVKEMESTPSIGSPSTKIRRPRN